MAERGAVYLPWATRDEWVETMLALNRQLGKIAPGGEDAARLELGALYDQLTSPERVAAANGFERDPGKQD